MRRAAVPVIVLCICFAAVMAFAVEPVKSGEAYACPQAVMVEVTIGTAGPPSGWDAMPARSRFTLAVKENAVRANTMICHYTNGTVDYNLTRVFPKGKTCYLAPGQSFMCQ